MAETLLQNPVALGAIAIILIIFVAIAVKVASGKKVADAGAKRSKGGSGASGVTVKAKLVWIEAAEGPFSNAFEYNARKEMKNGALRELFVKIVNAWDKEKKGGVIMKHPSGRETQVIKFKGGQKVSGKPYLEVEYVSFTSDRRRTLLFLDGAPFSEIECKDAEVFDLARRNILAYKESGRKTCPKSNLGIRDTFVAPSQKEE